MKGFIVSKIHLPPIKKAKVKTVKNTATFFTVIAGFSHFTPFASLEAFLFVIGGVIAIYEPYFVEES